MKKFSAAILFFAAISNQSFSQTPDWSTTIASIIYKHCTACHHEGGMAPFSLISYDDAYAYGISMEAYVDAKLMPPWPPDPNYNHLKDERVLSANEITLINSWVDNGMPSGDLDQAPAPPVYSGNSMMINPDQTIHLPLFTPPSVGDLYWRFVNHSGYDSTKYLNAVEFVAGNPSIIHHLTVGQDDSGLPWVDDSLYPGPGCPKGFGSNQWVNVFMTESEGRVTSLPENLGFKIPAGSDYVSDFHFYNDSIGEIDSSKINFKFCTDPNPRAVNAEKLLYGQAPSLINGPLEIPANTIKTFHLKSDSFLVDQSILGMAPHSHLICKSWKVYLVNPSGDTIPLILIPDWDSGWQGGYLLTKVIKAPAGSVIYATAVYDNTINNPHNPYNPPQDIHGGNQLFDEMAQVAFWIMDYQPGDEDIILDSSFYFATSTNNFIAEPIHSLNVFPNPAVHSITVQYEGRNTQDTYFNIYNPLGEVVLTTHEKTMEGKVSVQLDCSSLPSGIYLLGARSGADISTSKFVIRK